MRTNFSVYQDSFCVMRRIILWYKHTFYSELRTHFVTGHTRRRFTACDVDELECLTEQWRCKDELQCIPREFLCNGENDCYDGSDEVACG